MRFPKTTGSHGESLRIGETALIKPEALLVEVPEQVERSTLTYVPRSMRLTSFQNFFSPLVWTFPRTYASAWSIT
jgi:hypothetical protein